jgi:hypothetical protein
LKKSRAATEKKERLAKKPVHPAKALVVAKPAKRPTIPLSQPSPPVAESPPPKPQGLTSARAIRWQYSKSSETLRHIDSGKIFSKNEFTRDKSGLIKGFVTRDTVLPFAGDFETEIVE